MIVYLRTLPIMSVTRSLHRDIATVIELREYVRLHQAIVEKINSTIALQPESPPKQDSFSLLHDRLDGIMLNLKHFETTLETTKEQLDNLLSLVSEPEPNKKLPHVFFAMSLV